MKKKNIEKEEFEDLIIMLENAFVDNIPEPNMADLEEVKKKMKKRKTKKISKNK